MGIACGRENIYFLLPMRSGAIVIKGRFMAFFQNIFGSPAPKPSAQPAAAPPSAPQPSSSQPSAQPPVAATALSVPPQLPKITATTAAKVCQEYKPEPPAQAALTRQHTPAQFLDAQQKNRCRMIPASFWPMVCRNGNRFGGPPNARKTFPARLICVIRPPPKPRS